MSRLPNIHRIHAKDAMPAGSLIRAYLHENPELKSMYNRFPADGAWKDQAEEKSRSQTWDRNLLVQVIREQYSQSGIHLSGRVQENLNDLLSENSWTVVTGHQLNLFTGPFYFISKILSVIRLSAHIASVTGKKIIPVYWMASEDHDMREIDHLTVHGKKLIWKTGWEGASGKCPCTGVSDTIQELRDTLRGEADSGTFLELLQEYYQDSHSLALATRLLVHKLFSGTGLIILDADDERLKRRFLPVMKDDLSIHTAHKAVSETSTRLSEKYKLPVHPRVVNLFYLGPDFRSRIDLVDGLYSTRDGIKTWKEEEILDELEKYPGRFSPNVVLRPLYQEWILPNLAYCGGPSELSYWLQFRSMFEKFGVPFPVLVSRNSVCWIDPASSARMDKFGIRESELFLSSDDWIRNYFTAGPEGSLNFDDELSAIDREFDNMSKTVMNLDATLLASLEAERKKLRNGITAIRAKLIRAQKLKNETAVNQIHKLKEKLFPGGEPAERVENFIPYYMRYGTDLFGHLLSAFHPYGFDQLFLREEKMQQAAGEQVTS